jgi:septation ring formation regulator
MREYKLPVVPESYYIELSEAQSAIKEIILELDKKPISISILNTRVDTARDLVLKLFSRTKEMIKVAKFSEMAIVYGNRYRSASDELDRNLAYSEMMFFRGEYQKSLELSINSLNRVEPGIYDKLIGYYGNEKN